MVTAIFIIIMIYPTKGKFLLLALFYFISTIISTIMLNISYYAIEIFCIFFFVFIIFIVFIIKRYGLIRFLGFLWYIILLNNFMGSIYIDSNYIISYLLIISSMITMWLIFIKLDVNAKKFSIREFYSKFIAMFSAKVLPAIICALVICYIFKANFLFLTTCNNTDILTIIFIRMSLFSPGIIIFNIVINSIICRSRNKNGILTNIIQQCVNKNNYNITNKTNPLLYLLLINLPLLYFFISDIPYIGYLCTHSITKDNRFTCSFDAVEDFDYTLNRNWKLWDAKVIYKSKLRQVEKFYDDHFVKETSDINSLQYASNFAILHRKRIEFCQTGMWLCNHSNNLGVRNLEPRIGMENPIPALKREIPLPRHKDTAWEIHQKFR